MARPAADPDAFTEAVDWFRRRLPLPEAEFESIANGSHERAFKVAGVAQADMVREVWEAIDDALARGATLEDFAKRVEERLSGAWGKEMPHRIETIFRTNMQHAYSRGRWEQQADPAVRAIRPYGEFFATLDLRTTPACRDADGVIRPLDDPWWETHNAPLHHRCRSTRITLTEEQARAKGVTPVPPSTPASEGFGNAPGADDWHVDWTKYPADVAEAARQKIAVGAPSPAPPPKVSSPEPAPLVPQNRPGPAPWKTARTVDDARQQIEQYGLKVSASVKGGKLARPDVGAPPADRVAHLNRVGEEIDRIRQRYPYWYEQVKGVTIAEQPTLGTSGVFMNHERQIVVPRDLTEQRWRDTIARAKAMKREPALVQDETIGWSRMTIRHELAHALDRNPKPLTFGDEWRFSRKDSLFNGIWKESARAAGRPVASHVRVKVSEYALTSLQERFAETVMMYTSPKYVPGSLPAAVERHLDEFLEKGFHP
jgi:SPP1 gp7 family putative phage head morphogenesis protein